MLINQQSFNLFEQVLFWTQLTHSDVEMMLCSSSVYSNYEEILDTSFWSLCSHTMSLPVLWWIHRLFCDVCVGERARYSVWMWACHPPLVWKLMMGAELVRGMRVPLGSVSLLPGVTSSSRTYSSTATPQTQTEQSESETRETGKERDDNEREACHLWSCIFSYSKCTLSDIRVISAAATQQTIGI